MTGFVGWKWIPAWPPGEQDIHSSQVDRWVFLHLPPNTRCPKDSQRRWASLFSQAVPPDGECHKAQEHSVHISILVTHCVSLHSPRSQIPALSSNNVSSLYVLLCPSMFHLWNKGPCPRLKSKAWIWWIVEECGFYTCGWAPFLFWGHLSGVPVASFAWEGLVKN